jgi:hypothetical protein
MVTLRARVSGAAMTIALAAAALAPATAQALRPVAPQIDYGEHEVWSRSVRLATFAVDPHDVTGAASIAGPDAAHFRITANACSFPSLPSRTCGVSVAFMPASLGPKDASLVLRSSRQTATVSLHGVAGTYAMHASPPAPLPDTEVGATSDPQQITVTNTGTLGNKIVDVSVVGGDSPDFATADDQCTDAELAHAASCTIGVAVTPSAEGLRTTTLTVTPERGTPASVTVTGRGVVFDGSTSDEQYEDDFESGDGEDPGSEDTEPAAAPHPPKTPLGPPKPPRRVTCRTAARGPVRCTLVFAPGKWTASAKALAVQARLSRKGRLYARGRVKGLRRITHLRLQPVRRLRQGRYKLNLVVRSRDGRTRTMAFSPRLAGG